MSTPATAEKLFVERSQEADGMDDMLPFGIQVQSRIYQRDGAADTKDLKDRHKFRGAFEIDTHL